MPTKLGNVLKAAERYGKERYGIDTVILWYRLATVAPAEIRQVLVDARADMDRWIGALAVTGFFALATVHASYVSGERGPLVAGAFSVALTPLLYSFGVRAAGNYGQALRALVDVSRFELAKAFGIELPEDANAERELWGAVSNLAAWGMGFRMTPVWEGKVDSAKQHARPEA
jgi:hypothetical protein